MAKSKSIIKAPINTLLLKISTFDVNLYDNINIHDYIDNITNYIFSDIHNNDIDIICLQGISDVKMMILLIDSIKKMGNILLKAYSIVPYVDTTINTSTSFEMTWNTSGNTVAINNQQDNIGGLILSKYPIINNTCIDIIQDKNLHSKLNNSKKVIIANINVNGYLVSVYNIKLTEDYLGVNNSEFRKHEVNTLKYIIMSNSVEIKKSIAQNNTKIIDRDVHIVCGNFNIPEIKNNEVNLEMTNIFKILKCVDIFRCLENTINIDNYGHTNIQGTRDCYINLILFKHNDMNELLNSKDILRKVYADHNIIAVLCYAVKHIKFATYYPVESIILIDMKEKEKMLEN